LTVSLLKTGADSLAFSRARSPAGLDLYGAGAVIAGGYLCGIRLNQLIGSSFRLEYLPVLPVE